MTIKAEFLDSQDGGRKRFRLLEDFIQCTPFGNRVIPKGFVSDGTSTPWWAWWVLKPWDYLEASIPHDYDYRVVTPEVNRWIADALYRAMLIWLGCPRWRCWLAWAALRIGGKANFRRGTIQ